MTPRRVQQLTKSRPAWGAWIEIQVGKSELELNIVAPRMGRVD